MGCELPRIKGNKMEDSIFICLRENGTEGEVKSICFDCKWLVNSWWRSIGAEVKAFFSVSNASWVVWVQQKGESFWVSVISGCGSVENPFPKLSSTSPSLYLINFPISLSSTCSSMAHDSILVVVDSNGPDFSSNQTVKPWLNDVVPFSAGSLRESGGNCRGFEQGEEEI